MLNFIRRLRFWIAPLASVAAIATVASACPTCSEGLAGSDPHHQSIAAGFYYSILFMMSMPYILLGSLGCLAYVSIRRAKLQQDSADGAGDAGPPTTVGEATVDQPTVDPATVDPAPTASG